MFAHTRSLCLAAALAAASLFNLSGEVSAAMQCGNHDDVAKILTAKYQESRHFMGIINLRMVMEIFMSPQGTWTILVTDTNGTACITATGEEWQSAPVTVAGRDS